MERLIGCCAFGFERAASRQMQARDFERILRESSAARERAIKINSNLIGISWVGGRRCVFDEMRWCVRAMLIWLIEWGILVILW